MTDFHLPPVVGRATWGGVGTVPKDRTPKTELGVHHTVSANRTWTETQERQHVFQLEAQHISQGWSTIGYSWVVFPSGRIYRGRGIDGLPAAQSGENSGTWAVAYAGNAELVVPPTAARSTIRALIEYLKPRGLKRLGGHREFPGASTACPGAKLQPYVVKYREVYRLSKPAP